MDSQRLEGIPLLAELAEEQRADVASLVHDVTVEAGETMALQGDNAYELFIIEEGSAEVQRDGETIATLGAGEVFGEIGVLVTCNRHEIMRERPGWTSA